MLFSGYSQVVALLAVAGPALAIPAPLPDGPGDARPTVNLVGDGNPHQNYYYEQVSVSFAHAFIAIGGLMYNRNLWTAVMMLRARPGSRSLSQSAFQPPWEAVAGRPTGLMAASACLNRGLPRRPRPAGVSRMTQSACGM